LAESCDKDAQKQMLGLSKLELFGALGFGSSSHVKNCVEESLALGGAGFLDQPLDHKSYLFSAFGVCFI
jgi:hypothetical protein